MWKWSIGLSLWYFSKNDSKRLVRMLRICILAILVITDNNKKVFVTFGAWPFSVWPTSPKISHFDHLGPKLK